MTATVVNHPGYRRQRLAREAAELRRAGLLHREIAEALGVSRSYAAELLIDPDGTLAKQRKMRYAGVCVDCGAPTSGCEGRRASPRCLQCASWASAVSRQKWTAELLIARIQEWARIYGEPPAMPDWGSWTARNQLRDEARAQRFEDADGHWPWFTVVVRRFGSWSEGLRAAGFEPRAPHGGGGNQRRRRDARTSAASVVVPAPTDGPTDDRGSKS